MEPAPLGGYYILFARRNATKIPLNRYMKHPICGDAYVLKFHKLERCAVSQNEEDKFHKAIYEDVPELLLDPRCFLLSQIINQKEWRVLPPSPIIMLGLSRMQELCREYSKLDEERKRGQFEKDTKHGEQRQQIKEEEVKETLKEERQISESEGPAQRQRDEMEADLKKSRRLQEKVKEDKARNLERGREEKERQVCKKARVLPKRKRKLEKKDTREPRQRQRRKIETQEKMEICSEDLAAHAGAYAAEVLDGLRDE